MTTRARMWLMVGLGSLVFMSNYVDKSVISVVAPHLLLDMHLTSVQLGAVFTAFAVSYTFLQPSLATLSDSRGSRRVVGAMVGVYGAATVLSGLVAGSYALLLAARVLTGAGEAASMPAVTGGLRVWVPRELRALVMGVLHAFTRVGAALTVPLAVLSYRAFGVTGPFWICGIATLAIAALWIVIFRDAPHGVERTRVASRGAWTAILRNRSLWALSLADFCYFYTVTIYLTWLPTFLVADRHFTLLKIGIVGALPFIGGALGGIVGGYISDTLGHRSGNARLWRRAVPFVGMVGSVALSLPAAFSTNQFATIALFSASFFLLDATISVFWAIAMDIGGDSAATAAGWMNTWANVGGIISPLVFGILVQTTKSWTLPFVVASVLMLIGAGLIWAIDPDDRLQVGEALPPATGGLRAAEAAP